MARSLTLRPEVAGMVGRFLCWLVGARAPEVAPAELQATLAAGEARVLVDVRGAEQFAAGHLPGAVHIPWERFGADAGRLDPSAPTVVY
jgi:rhodanese-related sulfurtransferase